MAFKNNDDKKAYWRANLSLMAKLLLVWFVVSFGFGILLVDVLNEIQFFGFKLGFWFAQQGAIYVFVVLIFVYMHKMNSLDKRFGVDEE
jgi:putative solute:sodium symporter small subunit